MISLKRVPGWEIALFDFMKSKINQVHDWGKNDCVMFAADVVLTLTGEDLAADYRGTYADREGAEKIIAEKGAETLGDFLASYLPEIPVAEAMRGDIVISPGPEGEFAAVCQGRTCVAPSDHGLIHIRRAQATRAFKVGE